MQTQYNNQENSLDEAKRQANFIMLRSLESQLPSPLFTQVLQTVSQSIQFPQRIDWLGESKNMSFEELKTNFSNIDQNYLTELLINKTNKSSNKNITNYEKVQDRVHLRKDTNKSSLHISPLLKQSQNKNIFHQMRDHKAQGINDLQKVGFHANDVSYFERMKTVMGHASIDNGEMTPIYNVHFDREGKFIISGADDGIIKIWDRETLTLQASLHGHQDCITDIDIDFTNKYMATASRDGIVYVWDFKKCIILEKLTVNNKCVNVVKFFQLKLKDENPSSSTQQPQKKSDKVQVLITCGDDGMVRVYEEEGGYLNNTYQQEHQNNEEGITLRRTGRLADQQKKSSERFCAILTPEEFRSGGRNKKIESITMNSKGIIVAGASNGEVTAWKLDFQALKSKQQKTHTHLGNFKVHQKSIHYCDFSPNNKFLFTGSTDGTAKVFKVEKDYDEIQQNPQLSQQLKQFSLNQDRLVVTFEEKGQVQNPQCDCITWSANGRYVIAAISCTQTMRREGQQEASRQDFSIIKVWDTIEEKLTQDLAKENGITLHTYSFVLCPHPKYEEILLSGSQSGQLIIWNLKTKRIIKKFIEYGVYAFEKYTFNDPCDGKFSPDGNYFVVGSDNGTLSLFSNEGSKHKYLATRVEQFFIQDGQMHDSNIYQNYQEAPLVCNSNLLPYEHQPPGFIIGHFAGQNPLTNEDYERQLTSRRALAQQEEEFIQNQLEEGLRNSFFNNNEQNQGQVLIDNDSDEEVIGVARRNRVIEDVPMQDLENHGQEQMQQQQPQRNGRGGAGRGRRSRLQQEEERQIQEYLQRRAQNPNYDPDNSLYDRSSDENFDINSSENFDGSSSDQSVDSNIDSESEYVVKRQNYHDMQRSKKETEIQQQQEEQFQRLSRTERAQRREQLRQTGSSEEIEETKKQRPRNTRRRKVESDEDEYGDYEFSDSDNEQERGRTKLTRNADKKKKSNRQLMSSEDESINSDDYDDDSFDGGRMKQKKETRQQRRANPQQNNSRSVNTRTQNRRQNRISYADMDKTEDSILQDEESSDIDMKHEEKKQNKKQSKKQTQSKNRKQQQEQMEIDENNEELEEDKEIQINTSTNSKKKTFYDEDYELIDINQQHNNVSQEALQNLQDEKYKQCCFCQRTDEYLLMGPFVRINQVNYDNEVPYYFHKDCLEINLYSRYDKTKEKYINIGKALEMLVKKSYKCQRCFTPGSTIKCSTCNKYYHGYLCSQLYLIWIKDDVFQCFECRNKQNYQLMAGKENLIDLRTYQDECKRINREYLLKDKSSLTKYVPQINDLVYYFFQGHEKFISSYNCYFYAGEQEKIIFQYPWKKYQQLKRQPTLCQIRNISYAFPSRQVMYLLKKYGKIPNQVQQNPEIIITLELQIVGENNSVIMLDYFPNEVADFLVLKDHVEHSYNKMETLKAANQFYGHLFTSRKNQQKVKIIKQQPREVTLYGNSQWEDIIYQQQEDLGIRNRQGRRGLRRNDEQVDDVPQGEMSFWDLCLFDNEEEQNLINNMCCFDEFERQRLKNTLQELCNRNKEKSEPFMSRVLERIAPDYRCHVPAESYINLILSRLSTHYYRQQDQMFNDLDLISYNAKIYNGEEDQLSIDAKRLMEKIRCELKKNINSVGDKPNQHKFQFNQQQQNNMQSAIMRQAGKLTAPPINSARMQSSSMQEFLISMENNLQNNIGRNRTKQIEDQQHINNRNDNKNGKQVYHEEKKEEQDVDDFVEYQPGPNDHHKATHKEREQEKDFNYITPKSNQIIIINTKNSTDTGKSNPLNESISSNTRRSTRLSNPRPNGSSNHSLDNSRQQIQVNSIQQFESEEKHVNLAMKQLGKRQQRTSSFNNSMTEEQVVHEQQQMSKKKQQQNIINGESNVSVQADGTNQQLGENYRPGHTDEHQEAQTRYPKRFRQSVQ